jgi:regulator of cell morphogenesis and NO signaling
MVYHRHSTAVEPEQMNLSELVDHIIAVHHEYVRRQLRLIESDLREALAQPGPVPELIEINQLYRTVSGELQQHLIREEQVIFPLIRELDYAQRRPEHYSGGLSVSVRDLQHDHEAFEHEVRRVRALTNNYQPPPGSGDAVVRLYERLADLERDMIQHTRLEDHVLIPRALAVRETLASRHRPFTPEQHTG